MSKSISDNLFEPERKLLEEERVERLKSIDVGIKVGADSIQDLYNVCDIIEANGKFEDDGKAMSEVDRLLKESSGGPSMSATIEMNGYSADLIKDGLQELSWDIQGNDSSSLLAAGMIMELAEQIDSKIKVALEEKKSGSK